MPYQYEDITVYYLGEEGSGYLKQKEIQDYEKIRAECKAKGTLWVDPLFEPTNDIIYDSDGATNEKYTLMRPQELCDGIQEPRFFIQGHNRFDVVQGSVGDCWLIASISALAMMPNEVFYRVVPHDQEFDENYCGAFHFRFWKFGHWIDVVVDDRIPVSQLEACFAHSNVAAEFWVALLEKAYAKLHGSYGALKAGNGADALEDFTGGVAEMYRFIEYFPPDLFEQMRLAYENNWPMVCATPQEPRDRRLMYGLQSFHSYTITAVEYVKTNYGVTEKLVRLRNPYGETPREYCGPWGDQSSNKISKWKHVSKEEKKRIGYKKSIDGEYWIGFDDFTKIFRSLQICRYLVSQVVSGGRKFPPNTWRMQRAGGEWQRWSTAGGSTDYDSYKENPRYKMKVYEQVGAEPSKEGNKYKCFIALLQDHRKSQRALSRKYYEIGFNVYQVSGNNEDSDAVIKGTPVLERCEKMREVGIKADLSAGEYVIVPFTTLPHLGCEFLIRIYSPTSVTIEEIPRKTPVPPMDADDVLWNLFSKFSGEEIEIDWRLFKELLDSSMKKDAGIGSWFEAEFKEGVPEQVCRNILAAYDGNKSNKLSFDEFRQLWIDIHHWKDIFVTLSKSNAGYLSTGELDKSIKSTYLKLNAKVDSLAAALMTKFGKDGFISFPSYLMCAVRFTTIITRINPLNPDDEKPDFEQELAEWFTNPPPVHN